MKIDKVIDHFIAMKKQAESNLSPNRVELSDWHRGLYSGERQAYKHCIKYLRHHLKKGGEEK